MARDQPSRRGGDHHRRRSDRWWNQSIPRKYMLVAYTLIVGSAAYGFQLTQEAFDHTAKERSERVIAVAQADQSFCRDLNQVRAAIRQVISAEYEDRRARKRDLRRFASKNCRKLPSYKVLSRAERTIVKNGDK